MGQHEADEDVLVVVYETSGLGRLAALLNHPLAVPCATCAAVLLCLADTLPDALVLFCAFYVARRVSEPWILDVGR